MWLRKKKGFIKKIYIRQKDKKELYNRVRPNTFITITVKQCIQTPSGALLHGNRERYDRIASGVLSGTERRLRGKRSWKRKKRTFPNITVVERGAYGRWHIHYCVRRPSGVTLQEFEDAFLSSWRTSSWYLDRKDTQEDRGYALHYILKDGQDSILLETSIIP